MVPEGRDGATVVCCEDVEADGFATAVGAAITIGFTTHAEDPLPDICPVGHG